MTLLALPDPYAYATFIDRGQGLNNALQDSSNFVSAIISVANGEKTLVGAIDAYDKEVLERGTLETDISLKQSIAIHDWDKLMQSPLMNIGMHRANDGDR